MWKINLNTTKCEEAKVITENIKSITVTKKLKYIKINVYTYHLLKITLILYVLCPIKKYLIIAFFSDTLIRRMNQIVPTSVKKNPKPDYRGC